MDILQLKKYSHLKGNIGKAWYDQRRLFEKFPGAILATTNCVMPIKRSYADRSSPMILQVLKA